MDKHNDGHYEKNGIIIQFPITDDEAFYAYHVCEWVHVPNNKRTCQQIHSRRITDGKPEYLMSWDFQWYEEAQLSICSPRLRS